ncbi:MAG: DEAD/DEAH box helicase, partial [Oscillospiraceae bacterium]|nr:DEAD/DEAH box helicase [Oscillospiraceae bacterium]
LGLFSATMSQEVMTVSWMYQRDEVEITVKADAESKPDIEQYSVTVSALEKLNAVRWILYLGGFERVIIFCNTKLLCQSLSDELRRVGVDADCIHGNIPQSQRERTMKSFRKGKLPVLIATDVASRGIDVDDVDCVINYDVPQENEYYIHRIGRTGRAKRKGVSYTVIGSFPEQAKLDEIAKYSHFTIQPVAITESGFVPVERKQATPVSRRRR